MNFGINSKPIKFLGYIFIFMFIVLLDRCSKFAAVKLFQNKDYCVFPGFNLTLVWNRGVSWGLFSFDSAFLFYLLTIIIFSIIIVFFIYTVFLFRKNENVFFEVLVFSGAVSNLIDRFIYKGVVDFIDIYVFSWHWPTFNIADMFVVIGIFGIFGRFLLDGCFREN
ncbi:signal peptidase II [Candidatus Dependentiae bacterium]